MFKLEYLTKYTGQQLSNYAKYGDECDPLVKFLSMRYEFCDYTPKPKRPPQQATKRCWDDYNLQLSRYNLQSSNSDKYKLDTKSIYVVAKDSGKFWVYKFDANKVVCHMGKMYRWTGDCYA